FFRGISANGVTATTDHAPVAAQYTMELADGAHTVGMQATWITAGVATWGRTRGNTADVPQHLVVVRWTASEEDEDPPADGDFTVALACQTLAADATATPQETTSGAASVVLAAQQLAASGATAHGDPYAALGDPFDYVGDPRDHGWSWLDLIP